MDAGAAGPRAVDAASAPSAAYAYASLALTSSMAGVLPHVPASAFAAGPIARGLAADGAGVGPSDGDGRADASGDDDARERNINRGRWTAHEVRFWHGPDQSCAVTEPARGVCVPPLLVVRLSQDAVLRAAVLVNEGKNWKVVARSLAGRTDVQCLHRWQKVLKPGLVKGPWTPEVPWCLAGVVC